MPDDRRTTEAARRCPNCEARLEGAYCHRCGQSTRTANVTVGQLARDLLGSIVSFDSRVWRTLHLILFRPGELTARYLAGQRARFVPPARLYVFVSLLYFLLMAWTGGSPGSPGPTADGPDSGVGLTLLTEDGDTLAVPDPFRIRGGTLVVPGEGPPASGEAVVDDTLAVVGAIGSGALALTQRAGEEDMRLPSFLQPMEPGIRSAREDPQGFHRRYLQWMSYLMFLLVPAFGGIVHLAYRGRRRYYLHHLLFAVHFHVVAFVVMGGVGALGALAGPESWQVGAVDAVAVAGNLGALALAVHLFLGLRRVYRGRVWTTLLRTFFVGITYLCLLVAGVAGVAVLALILQ